MAIKETKKRLSILLGAAFIMATSAVGPGFLTQTGVFTGVLGSDFAFVIVVAAVVGIIVQLTFWRILCVSNMRAQDLGNKIYPGLGYFLAFAIVLGGLAFNIGNIGGAAIGLRAMFGIPENIGALIAGAIGITIFALKNGRSVMDKVAQTLGGLMILMIGYVAISTAPPVGEALTRAVRPSNFNVTVFPILTLVGGTVGGYISFAGGHRLIDAGIVGKESIKEVDKGAYTGIIISTFIRILLFFAILGVVITGFTLDPGNPTGSAFGYAVGNVGYKIFGAVLFAAGITSVIGAAYTSVSFIKTFSETLRKNEKLFIIGFIALSTLVMSFVGRPVSLLIFAGAVNGLILPLSLSVMLLVSKKKDIIGDYKLPTFLFYAGWIIVVAMTYLGATSFYGNIIKLL